MNDNLTIKTKEVEVPKLLQCWFALEKAKDEIRRIIKQDDLSND